MEFQKMMIPVRTISCWNDVPREVVESPAVGTCKICLHRGLGQLV